jgi:hypothetical protein
MNKFFDIFKDHAFKWLLNSCVKWWAAASIHFIPDPMFSITIGWKLTSCETIHFIFQLNIFVIKHHQMQHININNNYYCRAVVSFESWHFLYFNQTIFNSSHEWKNGRDEREEWIFYDEHEEVVHSMGFFFAIQYLLCVPPKETARIFFIL